jgi:hypothetical protein
MERNYKLTFASIFKLINDDNCKSIMNLSIKSLKDTNEFKNCPDWFFNHCEYTIKLIQEIREIVYFDKNIMNETELKKYIADRINKDSNLKYL